MAGARGSGRGRGRNRGPVVAVVVVVVFVVALVVAVAAVVVVAVVAVIIIIGGGVEVEVGGGDGGLLLVEGFVVSGSDGDSVGGDCVSGGRTAVVLVFPLILPLTRRLPRLLRLLRVVEIVGLWGCLLASNLCVSVPGRIIACLRSLVVDQPVLFLAEAVVLSLSLSLSFLLSFFFSAGEGFVLFLAKNFWGLELLLVADVVVF